MFRGLFGGPSLATLAAAWERPTQPPWVWDLGSGWAPAPRPQPSSAGTCGPRWHHWEATAAACACGQTVRRAEPPDREGHTEVDCPICLSGDYDLTQLEPMP